MHQCKKCGLAFDQVDASGHCEGCAEAPAAPARDPQIDAIIRETQQTNARVEMLANSMQRQQAPPPQPQQVPDRNEVNRAIWGDPSGAMNSIAQQHAQAVAGQIVNNALAGDQETMVNLARSQARAEDPEMFDKFEAEINQRVAQLGPQYHRQFGIWKTAFQNTLGAHHRELRQQGRDATTAAADAAGTNRMPAFRVAGDGPAAPSTRQAPSTQRVEALTDDAKHIARKLGITEDQMRRGIKDFENQGDEKDPTKPSSWDKVFSSSLTTGPLGRRREARRQQQQLAGARA